MAKVFAITTTSTEKVEAVKGNATAVFTVTNTTSRPLRCMARLKPLGNTQMSWLKIDGEVERDLAAGATDNFTVNFSRPAPVSTPTTSQPAESFQFRFDAVSAANPNEDFAEGPVVAVEIPETVVTEPKAFPWWILAVAAGVLIVGGVVAWLIFRPDPRPPVDTDVLVQDVRGMGFADAKKLLEDSGLKVTRSDETAPDKELEKVFKQDPSPGEKKALGSTVTLSLPAATKVPPVANRTLSEAIKVLENRQLDLGSVSGDADAINNGTLNQVQRSDPPENTPVQTGSKVNLIFKCVPQPPFGLNCRVWKKEDLLNKNPNIFREMQRVNP